MAWVKLIKFLDPQCSSLLKYSILRSRSKASLPSTCPASTSARLGPFGCRFTDKGLLPSTRRGRTVCQGPFTSLCNLVLITVAWRMGALYSRMLCGYGNQGPERWWYRPTLAQLSIARVGLELASPCSFFDSTEAYEFSFWFSHAIHFS